MSDGLTLEDLNFGPYRIDRANRSLRLYGDEILLAPKSFAVLLYLAERAGTLVTKEDLLNAVWPDTFVSEGVLKRAVLEIRKALGDDADEPRFIQTLHRRGYRFVEEMAVPQPIAPAPVPPPLAISKTRIAVLPFVSMSADPENEYFSDGLTEELINRLAQMPALQVVARTSVFHFKGKNEDIRDVGAKLSVGSVIEGSVRKAGDMLRVTVQLINCEDGYHLWSQTYDRQLKDVFAIQDEISTAVAGELGPRIGLAPKRTAPRGPANLEAYTLYLQGRHHARRLMDDVPKGIRCYQAAIASDPDYAPAYSGLAGAYYWLCFLGLGPAKIYMPLAKEAALKALSLDENYVSAYVTLGLVESVYDWNWADGEAHLRRAAELDSENGAIYEALCQITMAQGRITESKALLYRARDLDPFAIMPQIGLIWALGLGCEYEATKQQYQVALTVEPIGVHSHFVMSNIYQAMGDMAESLRCAEKGCEVAGAAWSATPIRAAAMVQVLAMAGEHERAMAEFANLEAIAQTGYVSPFDFALAYAGLRDREKTIASLSAALEERSLRVTSLKIDPRFAWLRESPEFQALLHRVNLA